MTEWIAGIVNNLGYVGIFLLLVVARVIPPVPAETVIPLAGIGAAQGDFNLILIGLAGGVGSALGEFLWYLPSRHLGPDRFRAFLRRHGRWIALRPDQVGKATDWFARRGGLAVMICQPVPGVRTFISIPAGACGMRVWQFLVYSIIGSTLWILVLAGCGYLAKRGWPWLAEWIGPGSLILFTVPVVIYAVRVARWRDPAPDPA
ncbi:DedA family protein [Azospirillum sp. RWY-5-1]|uniref:DedA family protein n=1 Tax=Azospirillum oleiclasticum TaxID=2735135 RepID=A0ABX2T7R1_9PROT|nr:DedA family protein [Azospirillum oleiclasticum]NYZ13215.1 DedA family protein [Azospirillum oleiclasticum]NYZ20112.1 DedA family protein [Azospirillum oleiclasticum]